MNKELLEQALADAKAQAPTGVTIEAVAAVVQEQIALEDRIEKGEQLLKELKAQLDEVRDKKLPDTMLAAKISSFETDDGQKVKLNKVYFPSLAKAKQDDFNEWLASEGHDGMISASVTFPFGKGNYIDAKKFMEFLHENSIDNKAGVEPKLSGEVHWATLRAFAKEQIEEGNELFDGMNVHSVTRATIKRK